jgi:hypothetical protein
MEVDDLKDICPRPKGILPTHEKKSFRKKVEIEQPESAGGLTLVFLLFQFGLEYVSKTPEASR